MPKGDLLLFKLGEIIKSTILYGELSCQVICYCDQSW